MFRFEGFIESSKSWLNRAKIIQYYNSELKIESFSTAKDVEHLSAALVGLQQGQKEFYMGEGGTTLRFFSFLVSRNPGTWYLRCHPRLLNRPQTELIEILSQLGVQAECTTDLVIIKTSGWKLPQYLMCSGHISSQFVSGVLLNSWKLQDDLKISLKKPLVSKDYLMMTIDLLKSVGLNLNISELDHSFEIEIAKSQLPQSQTLQAEPDISSAFSLIAAGVVNGDVKITNWVEKSTQPDISFLQLFQSMGLQFLVEGQVFAISKQANWLSVEANLVTSPDLFPVLAVLCALARGTSRLYGASHLKAKESNRIEKTCELLNLCGFETKILEDGAIIEGQSSKKNPEQEIQFSTDQDHRMAMAAGVLKLAGYNIKIQNPEVVDKSYPRFWNDIQVVP